MARNGVFADIERADMNKKQWKIFAGINAAMVIVWILCLGNSCSSKPVQNEPTIAVITEDEDYNNGELLAQANDDTYVVALTIFAEARGETTEGRLAVASVIWNRAHGHKDMLAEVCIMNKQFSCWNGKAGEKLLKLRESDLKQKEAAIFRECLKTAKNMVEGKFVPSVKLATHYHATSVNPNWAGKLAKVAIIGKHIFYAKA